MAKGFFKSLTTLGRNLLTHAFRVFTRRESARDAAGMLTRDTRKLSRSLTKAKGSGHRREATHLVEEGRQAYNLKQFGKAEDLFRQAIVVDTTCAIAYTYLGHCLHKQGRGPEALLYWQKAIEVDPDSDAASNARRKLQHARNERAGMEKWMGERLDKKE